MSFLTTAFWVGLKELKESLREPTVLLFSVGFPIIFYPMLIWGLIQLVTLEAGLFEQQPPTVAVDGPAALADAAERAGLRPGSGGPEDVAPGRVDLFVEGRIEGEQLAVEGTFASTRPASQKAWNRFGEALDELEEERAEALAIRVGTTLEALEPPSVERDDLAPPAEVTAFLLSRAIPALALVSLLLGAAYPSVEVIVGERERKTIETTLMAAVPRPAILAGKVGAVMALVALATFGNFFAVMLTMLQIQATFGAGEGTGIALHYGQLLAAAPIMVATAALAVSVMVLAALPASSFKQGQSMVSVISTIGMSGAMVGVVPGVELDLGLAFVPFANAVLVLRDSVAGDLQTLPALVGAAVNGTLALLALWAVARIASRETFLFGMQLPRWMQLVAGAFTRRNSR